MWLGATYQEQDDILTSPRYWSEFPVDISIHLLAFAQIAGSSRQRPWISHLSLWSSPVWAACGEEIFAGVQNGWGRFLPREGLRTEGSACPCVCHAILHIHPSVGGWEFKPRKWRKEIHFSSEASYSIWGDSGLLVLSASWSRSHCLPISVLGKC